MIGQTLASALAGHSVAGLLTGMAPDRVRSLPDAILAAFTDWSDPASVAVCQVEANRRDAEDVGPFGAPWEPRTGPRLPHAERAADEYRDAVHAAYLAAEEFTRGHMLNERGRRADIDPETLFTGPRARAYAYASWELAEWFDAHGRPTMVEWRRDAAGSRDQATDLDARKVTA